VATGSYVGEGFDDNRLDVLLLAGPVSGETVLTQYTGRIHRRREGKTSCIVYDYCDIGTPMLERMYRKRLRTYKKLGYMVDSSEIAQGACDKLYGGDDFVRLFNEDIGRAVKDIIIFSEYSYVRRIESLLKLLASAVTRGVCVRLVTGRLAGFKNKEDNNEAFVSIVAKAAALGIDVIDSRVAGSSRILNAAVIDSVVVWYGGIPPLAYAKAGEGSIRVTSKEIAKSVEGVLRSLD
jgi:hypothetical protein